MADAATRIRVRSPRNAASFTLNAPPRGSCAVIGRFLRRRNPEGLGETEFSYPTSQQAKSSLLNKSGFLASLNSGSMPVHLKLHRSNNFAWAKKVGGGSLTQNMFS